MQEPTKPDLLRQEALPDPAVEALEAPRLSAEDLQLELGDSEVWDEPNQDADATTPAPED